MAALNQFLFFGLLRKQLPYGPKGRMQNFLLFAKSDCLIDRIVIRHIFVAAGAGSHEGSIWRV